LLPFKPGCEPLDRPKQQRDQNIEQAEGMADPAQQWMPMRVMRFVIGHENLSPKKLR
jgi:hypothetical protein